MLRNTLAIAILLAASSTSAQPAACAVTIVRAPDDVRAVVESWVRAEPRCTHALEVRIVPTDGELYVFARDERGHIHERVVPDAQTAGVLIASWAADDSTSTPPALPPPPATAAPAIVAARPTSAPGLVASLPPTASASPRWIALGGLLAVGNTGTGARGELDLFTLGRWSLGADVAVTAGTALYEGPQPDHIGVFDASVLAQLAGTWDLAGWHVRPAIAGGGVYTRVTSSMSDQAEVSLVGQASLMVGRDLGAHWGFEVGPVVTLFSQHMNGPSFLFDRPLEASVFAGARYRL